MPLHDRAAFFERTWSAFADVEKLLETEDSFNDKELALRRSNPQFLPPHPERVNNKQGR